MQSLVSCPSPIESLRSFRFLKQARRGEGFCSTSLETGVESLLISSEHFGTFKLQTSSEHFGTFKLEVVEMGIFSEFSLCVMAIDIFSSADLEK